MLLIGPRYPLQGHTVILILVPIIVLSIFKGLSHISSCENMLNNGEENEDSKRSGNSYMERHSDSISREEADSKWCYLSTTNFIGFLPSEVPQAFSFFRMFLCHLTQCFNYKLITCHI
jgi:hypothetical protein